MSSASTSPDLTFFTDYSLGGVTVAAALRAAGARVEIHLDWFAPDLPDTDLLAEIGRRGWIFLSKDSNIRRRPLETNALLAARVRAFILSSGNLRGEEQAEAFVRALPAILKVCAQRSGPLIARVTRSGDVAIIRE